MTSIIYVGMDVHTTNYTLCCYSMEDDRFFAEVQVEPDVKSILKYLARVEKQQNKGCRIVCGYEAGCLGYQIISPRIAMSAEAYPNRWTHHVIAENAGAIDETLLAWIDEAYTFSKSKR